jgi:hypothetical protein
MAHFGSDRNIRRISGTSAKATAEPGPRRATQAATQITVDRPANRGESKALSASWRVRVAAYQIIFCPMNRTANRR